MESVFAQSSNYRPQSFAEKVGSLKENRALVEEIKANCTLQEIKEIIYRWVKLVKKFNDGLNQEVVDNYSKQIKIGEAAMLSVYLQGAEITQKPSRIDVMSLVNDKTSHVSIGQSKVALISKDGEVKERNCPGAVIGGQSGPQAITQVMSVCAKQAGMGKDNEKRTFHVNNKLAPQPGLITALASINEIRNMSINDLEKQAQKIDNLSDDDYTTLSRIFNEACAPITVNGVKVPICTLSLNQEDGKSYKDIDAYPFEATRLKVVGEYSAVAAQLETYRTGAKFPALKRIARNMWTGCPIDNLPCDHVIALHDAGVPVDSKILAVTADTNIVSLLRANFGPNVMGVGISSPQFVSSTEAKMWDFDYVYYPTPITMSTAGSFENVCSSVKEKMLRMFSDYSVGKVICHISPMVFYCQEFCDVFGVKYGNNGDPVKLMVSLDKKPEPKEFVPTKVDNYPIIQSRKNTELEDAVKLAQFYSDKDVLYNKLIKVTKFTQLSWPALDKSVIPAVLTQLSHTGTILYGAKTTLTVSQAVGQVLSLSRDMYRAIWHTAYASPNKYVIRLFVEGAVVENLEYSDMYSALYRGRERERFEDQDKKAIASINSVSENETTKGPPPAIVKPVRVRQEAGDLDDFN